MVQNAPRYTLNTVGKNSADTRNIKQHFHWFNARHQTEAHRHTLNTSPWSIRYFITLGCEIVVLAVNIDTGTNIWIVICMKCKSLCFVHISMPTAHIHTQNQKQWNTTNNQTEMQPNFYIFFMYKSCSHLFIRSLLFSTLSGQSRQSTTITRLNWNWQNWGNI